MLMCLGEINAYFIPIFAQTTARMQAVCQIYTERTLKRWPGSLPFHRKNNESTLSIRGSLKSSTGTRHLGTSKGDRVAKKQYS